MKLSRLAGRRVAVLGAGADVSAAVPALLAAGPSEVRLVIEGASDRPPPGLEGVPRLSMADAARWAEILVRSPGVPRYRPELVAADGAGVEVTTPMDLWLGTHGPDHTVVGVTGTKGKSTTVSLVGHLAATAGLRVGVAGNLGPPVLGSDWDHEAPMVVLEVSSYQAADVHHVPDLGVLTSLAQDHLSWHGGLDRYVADKLRLFRNEGGTASAVLVPEESEAARAALLKMGIEPVVVAAPSSPPEVPRHRVLNAALAAEVVHRLGGPDASEEAVLEAASTSLPGRLDRCDGPANLFCYDDALASNPSATAAALAWLRGLDQPTVVLVGGREREVDPQPLVDEVARWASGRLWAVALPDTGPELVARCRLELLARVDSVEDGVARAVGHLGGRGAILFSPAAATPERIGNWSTRSGQFRAALERCAGLPRGS